MSDNEMQSSEKADTRTASIRAEIWHALPEIAGRQIDPENAELCCRFGQVVDPYGVCPDLPPECDCVGRLYFARNPGSRIWVEFGDLPDATREALWKKPDEFIRLMCRFDFPALASSVTENFRRPPKRSRRMRNDCRIHACSPSHSSP
jgi:hypothetical protein